MLDTSEVTDDLGVCMDCYGYGGQGQTVHEDMERSCGIQWFDCSRCAATGLISLEAGKEQVHQAAIRRVCDSKSRAWHDEDRRSQEAWFGEPQQQKAIKHVLKTATGQDLLMPYILTGMMFLPLFLWMLFFWPVAVQWLVQVCIYVTIVILFWRWYLVDELRTRVRNKMNKEWHAAHPEPDWDAMIDKESVCAESLKNYEAVSFRYREYRRQLRNWQYEKARGVGSDLPEPSCPRADWYVIIRQS